MGGDTRRPPEQDSWVGLTGSYARPLSRYILYIGKYLIYMLKSPRVALKKNIYIYFFFANINYIDICN